MNVPRLCFLCICVSALSHIGLGGEAGGEWKEVSRKPDLVVYNRERAGSPVKEVRAVGRIDAPNWVVKNVIDDAEHYAQFMPYTAESRVLSRDASHHTLLAYARLTPPAVGARDYTILVHDQPHKGADGAVVYESRWELANARGPAEKSGVVRVKVNEGAWVLESIEGGAATRATYLLFTDGGGGLPSFVVNLANRRSIADLFDVIRKQAREERYKQSKPEGPGK